jgi:hypothetical protein
MKHKVWREAGFGGYEIVFIIGIVGFIYGVAIPRHFPSMASIVSILILIVTVPACLAGWLGKIIFPKWTGTTVRSAKNSGALAGCCIVLLLIAIPNLVRPHTIRSPNACVNNLRLIDSAKHQWALEKGKLPTDVPTASELRPYLGRGMPGELPYCPVDRTMTFENSYSINSVAEKPTCKLWPSTHFLP